MNFLNLNLAELLGIAGAISAGVVALYLLDRSKRKQIVATLRFWSAADVRTELKHRRRIQQPWSLVLQLVSLALLLLALAGPRWGGDEESGRDHVVILDTSAWMGARTRTGMLIDEARNAARDYIHALPSRDRVMLVRADALATPATAFELNRGMLDQALQESQPGASALNLEQAIAFAQRAQKLQSQRAGEIVFAGAGRIKEDEPAFAPPSNLRVLPVNSTQENVGLRKIGLRRSLSDPDSWDIYVAVKNYGTRARDISLALAFGGAPAASKAMTLKPGAEEQASFTYRTSVAGVLEARINPRDAFPQDDRAAIELPAHQPLEIAIYSAEPQALRALFASNPQVHATFEPPEKFDARTKAAIVVLDRFVPPAAPRVDSIWIEPPASGSPVAVRETNKNVKLERWRSDTPLGAGLRTKDLELASAEIFKPAPGDIPVAEVNGGAVIVARASSPKIVALGFEPLASSMKYELATPLLAANILRWMAPETFRRWEVQAGTVGTVSVPMDPGVDPANVRVVTEDQRPLPFTVDGNSLRFFAGAPGTVRVLAGERETDYSLTLPDPGDSVWRAPQNVRRGVPRAAAIASAVTDFWPWLALAGGLGLLIDWLLFGRSRAFRLRASKVAARVQTAWRKAS
ncbi:MAG TPA: VWA domain-containing protein [Bryobacteraceae bacterium]|nr:VWA domain-containing protein [Bryobacteraceae bacterium]